MICAQTAVDVRLMFGYYTSMSIVGEKLAFVDVETSGSNFRNGGITEIGIIRIENSEVVGSYKQFLNPGMPIPSEITRLTGITNADVENAPTFRDAVEDIADMLDGCTLVAHNARFDYGFLKHAFAAIGVEYNPRIICTVRLSRSLYPQYRRHSLDEVVRRHGIAVLARHRAYDDARAIWEFYAHLLREFDLDTIDAALRIQYKRQALPPNIDSSLIDRLPSTPGVYVFEGVAGVPLYVGKSVNIKQRVLSHFTEDTVRVAEMRISSQLRHVRYILASGDLGAMLLESDMIKELQPLHNRRLRRYDKMAVVMRRGEASQYFRAEIAQQDILSPINIPNVLGVFRSTAAARTALMGMASEYGVCKKLLGIEKVRGKCFGYQLGSCQGACGGLVEPIRHNLMFMEGFARHKMQSWPFAGPIQVTESSRNGTSVYVFNNWCFISERHVGPSGHSEHMRHEVFDIDRYKILRRYLAKTRKNVVVLDKVDGYSKHSQVDIAV